MGLSLKIHPCTGEEAACNVAGEAIVTVNGENGMTN